MSELIEKTLYEKLCEEFPNHAVNSRGVPKICPPDLCHKGSDEYCAFPYGDIGADCERHWEMYGWKPKKPEADWAK